MKRALSVSLSLCLSACLPVCLSPSLPLFVLSVCRPPEQTGIFTAPVRGARSGGVGGFLKGVGKGLAGVVTKPAAGALDFASQTTRGIASTAGTSHASGGRLHAPRLVGAVSRTIQPRLPEDDVVLKALKDSKLKVENYVGHVLMPPAVLVVTTTLATLSVVEGDSDAASAGDGHATPALTVTTKWAFPMPSAEGAGQVFADLQRSGRRLAAHVLRSAGQVADVTGTSWVPVILGVAVSDADVAEHTRPTPAPAHAALDALSPSQGPGANAERVLEAWHAVGASKDAMMAAVRRAHPADLSLTWLMLHSFLRTSSADLADALAAVQAALTS